jgi:hypothetical protein
MGGSCGSVLWTSPTRALAWQEAAQQWCATEVALGAISAVPTQSRRGDRELPLQGLGLAHVWYRSIP